MCDKTIMCDIADWAWLAGFFDGEGCTQVLPGSRYAVQVVITQKDIRVLEKAQSIAGGSISGPYNVGRTEGGLGAYQWRVSTYEGVVYALERMWPYMSEVKRMQAIEAFITRETKRAELGIDPKNSGFQKKAIMCDNPV